MTKRPNEFGRDEWRGRVAATLMEEEDWEVISEYTDRQAVEDGVLVRVDGVGGVNRVTKAVFDHFAKRLGSSSITGPVIDITPVMDAIRTMAKIAADGGGWHTGTYQGKKLWLVPNEVNGLTLMFPEDY